MVRDLLKPAALRPSGASAQVIDFQDLFLASARFIANEGRLPGPRDYILNLTPADLSRQLCAKQTSGLTALKAEFPPAVEIKTDSYVGFLMTAFATAETPKPSEPQMIKKARDIMRALQERGARQHAHRAGA